MSLEIGIVFDEIRKGKTCIVGKENELGDKWSWQLYLENGCFAFGWHDEGGKWQFTYLPWSPVSVQVPYRVAVSRSTQVDVTFEENHPNPRVSHLIKCWITASTKTLVGTSYAGSGDGIRSSTPVVSTGKGPVCLGSSQSATSRFFGCISHLRVYSEAFSSEGQFFQGHPSKVVGDWDFGNASPMLLFDKVGGFHGRMTGQIQWVASIDGSDARVQLYLNGLPVPTTHEGMYKPIDLGHRQMTLGGAH
jgi:hypothetical protein